MNQVFISSSNGDIQVNGKSYRGNSVTVRENRVFVDGVEQDELTESKIININIVGNVEKLETVCGNVTVTGAVGFLNTTSGDVNCLDVLGSIKTVSGDVSCREIKGNVNTVSGDVNKKFKVF